MEYSNTTTKGGIIQREEMLCNLGDGGISNNATLLKQFTALNNASYYEIWMAEMSVDHGALADDFNYTDFPDAPITLVASQSDYTLPVATTGANVATFLRLNGVYYTQGPMRTYLDPIQFGDEFMTSEGVPTAYTVSGKSIELNVPPNAQFVTDHPYLQLEFQRVPDAFASTDTTQQPGFMETYHDLIPLKSSASYMLPINPQLAQMYEERFRARLELFKRDIARMDASRTTNFTSEPIQFR